MSGASLYSFLLRNLSVYRIKPNRDLLGASHDLFYYSNIICTFCLFVCLFALFNRRYEAVWSDRLHYEWRWTDQPDRVVPVIRSPALPWVMSQWGHPPSCVFPCLIRWSVLISSRCFHRIHAVSLPLHLRLHESDVLHRSSDTSSLRRRPFFFFNSFGSISFSRHIRSVCFCPPSCCCCFFPPHSSTLLSSVSSPSSYLRTPAPLFIFSVSLPPAAVSSCIPVICLLRADEAASPRPSPRPSPGWVTIRITI